MKQVERNTDLWAERIFGHARLGDVRRTRRLVSVTAAAARRPHAHITRVFEGSSEMHTAYDFVENDKIDPSAMVDALGTDTATQCLGERHLFIATDGGSISMTDNTGRKKTGRIGTHSDGGVGDKVHAALAINELGAVIGPLDLQFWQRTGPSRTKQRRKLPTDQKETQRWLDARAHARDLLEQHAPGVRRHFLHDREADAWPILLDADAHRATEDSTIRVSWDRRVMLEGEDERLRLREQLDATPTCGQYQLNVSGRPGRKERVATLDVRATQVTLRLTDKLTSRTHHVQMSVVQAIEVGTTPSNEKPIEWLLYTTQAVQSFDDAVTIVRQYSFRWRIEEFFFAWKTGGTDAESTQLEGRNRERWLIILAAVAARAIRLKFLAREQPRRDPKLEFDELELAVIEVVLAESRRKIQGRPTLDLIVRAIAGLGGYVQQKSNPHPGTQTLMRGLTRVGDMVLGARLAGVPRNGGRSRQ